MWVSEYGDEGERERGSDKRTLFCRLWQEYWLQLFVVQTLPVDGGKERMPK